MTNPSGSPVDGLHASSDEGLRKSAALPLSYKGVDVFVSVTVSATSRLSRPCFPAPCMTDGLNVIAGRATDGTRTRDLNLGKVALYQLSYYRVGTAGFEPAISCSQSRRLTKLGHIPWKTETQNSMFPLSGRRRIRTYEAEAAGLQPAPVDHLGILPSASIMRREPTPGSHKRGSEFTCRGRKEINPLQV